MIRRFKDLLPLQDAVRQPMDKLLFWVTVLLVGIGIVSVFDASYTMSIEKYNDAFHVLKPQIVLGIAGAFVLWILRLIPFWVWKKSSVYGLTIAYFMLVAVFVPHVGHKVLGASRWIGSGIFRLQPSEYAKLAVVVYLAGYAASRPNQIKVLQSGLLRPLIFLALVLILIAKEPDLGTSLVIGASGLLVLCVAGAKPKHMIPIVLGTILVVGVYSLSKSYRQHRIQAWEHPAEQKLGNGYQVWHSLVAIGSGGLTGLGLGEGREKTYIPMAQNDFIFAVIGEEWGLVGTLSLLGLFLLFAVQGFSIAHRTQDRFGALLAAGITSNITIQALINIAVATGSIPDTGVPLPFISSGGSSLLFTMAQVGILLNISSHPDHNSDDTDKLTPPQRDFERRHRRVGRDTGRLRIISDVSEPQANTFARDWTSGHE